MNANSILMLVGRICLGAIFVMSGIGKIVDREGTIAYMNSAGLPAAPVLYVLTIIVELGGAIMVIVGFKGRWGALLLALFLIPVTLKFHNFWAYAEPARRMQQVNFLKNLAIFGGLLVLASAGPGKASVDECCHKPAGPAT